MAIFCDAAVRSSSFAVERRGGGLVASTSDERGIATTGIVDAVEKQASTAKRQHGRGVVAVFHDDAVRSSSFP